MTNAHVTHFQISRRCVLGGAATLLSGCHAKIRQPKGKHVVQKKMSWQSIDDLAQNMIERRIVPGFSLSLMSGGEFLYSKGFGVIDFQTKDAVTAQSRFKIASVTKQFTACAILLLHEKGKLDIDDKLSKFFPDFPHADVLSLRQMMQHTSGLGDHVNGQKASLLIEAQSKDYDDAAIMEILKKLKPVLPYIPGDGWHYSNTAFTLLGLIVSKVSGQSYAQFCKDHFFAPLGMSRTSIDAVDFRSDGQTLGYRATRYSNDGFGEVFASSPSFLGGAGAITGTTEDLCRWHNFLLGGRVLSFDSLKQMLAPAVLNDGRLADQHRGTRPLGYGLGQGLGTYANRFFITHNGRVNGFGSHLGSIPEANFTVAMLVNCDGIGDDRFNLALRDIRDEARRLALLTLGFEDIGPWIIEQNAIRLDSK